MFLKCNGVKKSDSKCDLIKERCDSIEIESLDLVTPKKRCQKWYIFNLTLLLAFVTLLTWTMITSHSQFTRFPSTPKVEDKISQMMTKVVSKAETILQDIRKRASHLNRKNRELVHKFYTKMWNAVKKYRNSSINKLRSIIEESINNIQVALQFLESNTHSNATLLVDTTQKSIQKLVDIVAISSNSNLIETVEEAITEVENCICRMLNNLDEVYSHQALYSREVIGSKLEDITNSISKLLRPTHEFRNHNIYYEHVKMCYNISLANIETTGIIKPLLQLEDNLYNTTNTIYGLQSLYSSIDEHVSTVIRESIDLLEKYEMTSQELLNDFLHDYYYFLGSAIRTKVEPLYPQCKRFILNAYVGAVENLYKTYKSSVPSHSLIKDEYENDIIDHIDDSLKELGNQIKIKAASMMNVTVKNKLIDQAQFEDLQTLMRNRLANTTQVINSLYTSALFNASDDLRFNVDFIISQKIPFVSILTEQNFLPTDICPLAMEFRDYLLKLLNDMVNKSGSDNLDYFLQSSRNPFSNDEKQIIGSQPRFLKNLDFKNVIVL